MNNMTTGQRIAARRKLANLSQEALSEELGVSRQAISKWESDAGLPDIDNLISLSKIFAVSVGWLLGTEADPTFDPSTGLSDAQLKMVEEIIHRSKPRSHRGLIALALALSIGATAILGIFFQGKLNDLSAENAVAQSQISALEQSNQTLIAQMDAMNASLSKQDEESKLLRSAHLKAYLNDDLQTVSVSFYLFPKLYRENAQAYVTVLNDEGTNSTLQTIQCIPSGELYFCQAELPVANGYRYSFLLATDGGFQEQDLTDMGYTAYFQDLHDATRYHLHSTAQVRTRWSAADHSYTFSQPIGSPIIDTRSAYVGYEAVEVTLYHNGEPVHAESLRDALREYGGAYMRFEVPYTLNFQAELPPLTPGDRLTLEITATSYEGNVFTDILEELVVIE